MHWRCIGVESAVFCVLRYFIVSWFSDMHSNQHVEIFFIISLATIVYIIASSLIAHFPVQLTVNLTEEDIFLNFFHIWSDYSFC